MSRILVTGGAGYVGSVLVPRLLEAGHAVRSLDLFLFGDHLPAASPALGRIKGDMRDQDLLDRVLPGHDIVIQLACISNDPSFELDPELSQSINFECFEPTVAFGPEFGRVAASSTPRPPASTASATRPRSPRTIRSSP